jgi:hypothetical protein
VRTTGIVESVSLDEILPQRSRRGDGGQKRLHKRRPHAVYSAVVAFEEENGKIHRFKTYAGSHPIHYGEGVPKEPYSRARYERGDKVPVAFSAGSPDWAFVDEPSKLPRGSGIALIPSLVLLDLSGGVRTGGSFSGDHQRRAGVGLFLFYDTPSLFNKPPDHGTGISFNW